MKIQFLVPSKLEPRLVQYFSYLLPADVDVVGLTQGGVIESRYDVTQVLPEALEAIVAAEKNGYNAVVGACLSDLGIEEGRELVNIPVLGAQQVSLHVYSLLGHKFTTFVPSEYLRRWSQQLVRKYGFEGRASVRALRKSVMAEDAINAFLQYKKSGKHPRLIIEDLVSQCIDAIKEDDAEVLAIGCGALVWAVDMVRDELSKRGYDIPVLEPYRVTLEIAKVLVNLGLTHGYLIKPPSVA